MARACIYSSGRSCVSTKDARVVCSAAKSVPLSLCTDNCRLFCLLKFNNVLIIGTILGVWFGNRTH
jgi:hypothetical protein